jgi:DNA-binding response OmpR family regulator
MRKKKKILVIDDADGIRKFLKITLENYQYTVIESNEGANGIEKFKSEKPDMVILDLGLPDIDGIDVLKTIRAFDDKTPIAILTVRSEERYINAAYKAGADAYVTKPFQIDQILETIEELGL